MMKSAKSLILGLLFMTHSFAMDDANKQETEAVAIGTMCYLNILSPDQVELSAERASSGLKVTAKGEKPGTFKLDHFSYIIPQNSVPYFIDYIIKEMGDETPHQKILNMFKALR